MKKLMIIVALVALPFLALAQVVPTPEDPSAFATFVLQAIQAKQWAVVGIAATIGLVFLLRKLGTKITVRRRSNTGRCPYCCGVSTSCGRSRTSMTSRRPVTTSRSMMFSTWRTLPGQ
jgi:hypothetical protein